MDSQNELGANTTAAESEAPSSMIEESEVEVPKEVASKEALDLIEKVAQMQL
jgi:hypothetical protein